MTVPVDIRMKTLIMFYGPTLVSIKKNLNVHWLKWKTSLSPVWTASYINLIVMLAISLLNSLKIVNYLYKVCHFTNLYQYLLLFSPYIYFMLWIFHAPWHVNPTSCEITQIGQNYSILNLRLLRTKHYYTIYTIYTHCLKQSTDDNLNET